MDIKLFNTLHKTKEIFTPLVAHKVTMYTCGPTVYNFAHIGNLRAYFFADTLKRVLLYNGFDVTHIINVTDIGHLTSDADDGEDKMVKAIKREGKEMSLESLKEVSKTYFEAFKKDFLLLNCVLPTKFTFASEHIADQIELIKTLDQKGFVYKTGDGLYFDTSKDPEYGILGGMTANTDHSRIGINPEKHNPEDFALWKFADKEGLGFDAPFGCGFPGWHIECSAMSMKYLGSEFDIHTGGIDHIPVHHNNEIAQSKAATDKILARYWVHNNHITITGEKMAKSGENFLSLDYIYTQGISPMGVRMWYLQSRYSTRVDYSLIALQASETAWRKLRDHFLLLTTTSGSIHFDYIEKFDQAVNDDLDTPKALVLLWELIKDTNITNEDKKATLLRMDSVFGFGLEQVVVEKVNVPAEVTMLLHQRKEARDKKDFHTSDHLRTLIREQGFEVKDQGDEQVVTKI